MILPMQVLAACCAIIGILPSIVVRPLNAVIQQWNPQLVQGPSLNVLAPVASLVPITLTVSAILLSAFLWSRWSFARAGGRVLTWDCGYARPGRRMQYSASSFAALLVEMFKAVLRPRVHQPKIAAPFPAATAKFHSQVDDFVLDGFLAPIWRRFRSRLGWLRVLQQGSVQTYVLYILIIVSLLLLLTMPLTEMLRSLLSGGAP